MSAPRRNPATPRQRVQPDPLPEQQLPRRTADRGNADLPPFLLRVEEIALFETPLHAAVALREDFVKERHPSEDPGGFAVQGRGAGRAADYEAAVVEAGRVFAEPVGDLGFEVDGEEVGGVAVCDCHFEGLCGGTGCGRCGRRMVFDVVILQFCSSTRCALAGLQEGSSGSPAFGSWRGILTRSIIAFIGKPLCCT